MVTQINIHIQTSYLKLLCQVKSNFIWRFVNNVRRKLYSKNPGHIPKVIAMLRPKKNSCVSGSLPEKNRVGR